MQTGRRSTGDGPATKKAKGAADKNALSRKIIYAEDPSYKFCEVAAEKSTEPLSYYPANFLRTHSKNNDPADVQTQIWQCVFEPDPEVLGSYTDIVATCGGSSVCFIKTETGEVILKYNRNTKSAATVDNLYALVWSCVPLDDLGIKRINIVATAGGKSTVLLMHPEAGVCYAMFRTVPNKAAATVCSLLFHPKKATWLFCGHEDGHIQLWDIGTPRPKKYEVNPVHLITIPAVARDAYNLAFSQVNNLLIAGCDGGLHAWKMDMDKIENNERLDRIEFILPHSEELGAVVDTITMLRDDILAVKCALHAKIYVIKLSNLVKEVKQKSNGLEIDVKSEKMLKLRWSETDNYYMNMGHDSKSCILVCGDDKGVLWVYDLLAYVTGSIPSPITDGPVLDKAVDPALMLDWPELQDDEVEKARKLRLDTYDIVVDNCSVAPGGKHIVAVTSNNMVCIWKRGLDDEDDDTNTKDEEKDL